MSNTSPTALIRHFPHVLAASLVVVLLQLSRGPAEGFIYDSVQYWGAPVALLTGGNVSDIGVLQIRGVLTPLVYLAPALATLILGPGSAGWTVLAWNSLLAVVVCIAILPGLAARIVPGRRVLRVWVSALLGGAVLSGFARYPHMDIWALGFALAGLYILAAAGSRWWLTLLGGFALSIGANLRPAYAAPVLLALAVVAIVRPKVAAWAGAGAVLGMLPQVIFNAVAMGQLTLSPVATPFLLGVQSAQAPFTIRYDTIAFTDRHPQQWYCDPVYAQGLVDDASPTSPLGVLGSALSHLPDSIWFLSQKAAASLRWSFATPYENAPGSGADPMWLLAAGVASVGLVMLVWATTKAWHDRTRRAVAVSLLAFWVGSVGTLVLSTPETRFALPLVFIGLVGLVAAAPLITRRTVTRGALVSATTAVLLTAAIVLIGREGTSHPLPPGPLTDARQCATMSSWDAPR